MSRRSTAVGRPALRRQTPQGATARGLAGRPTLHRQTPQGAGSPAAHLFTASLPLCR